MKYRNKAHQTAFNNGLRASQENRLRISPYDGQSRSSAEFRRAYLAGYDSHDQAQSVSPVAKDKFGFPVDAVPFGTTGGAA